MLSDGSGDYLSVPDSDDWNFGTGDFTIDAWVRPNSQDSDDRIYNQYVDTNNRIQFGIDTASLQLYVRSGGSTLISLAPSYTFTANTWYHVAVVRSGNIFTMYVNGSDIGNTTAAITMPDIAAQIDIGTYFDRVDGLDGYIDEFRISKGIARWTANFTPPTAPY